ncbi:enoyl-CoA hydratase/isomerase family protein [Streptomyces albidoflavus]
MTTAPHPAHAEPEPDVTHYKTLRTARLSGVLTIELNTPEHGNAVSEALLDDLLNVLQSHEYDPGVRVIVLRAAGPHFSLGGDREEFADHLADDPAGAGIRLSATKGRRVCELLTANQAVTIARVHGKAIGAGMALALACDLRVGAEDTTFRLPEMALGLPTAWGGLLPRLINELGPARVREMILTGRPVGAEEARELSVLQRVVPADDLDIAVSQWATPVLRRHPAALRVTKLLINSLAASSRLADASLLDAEFMASVASEVHAPRS